MKTYLEAKDTKELCKLLELPTSSARKIEIRIDLAIAIRKELEHQGLTQAQAAKKAGVGRTVIAAITNGNLQSISTDRLIDVAQGLGLDIQLLVA